MIATGRALAWAARILGVVFAAFISVFAADAVAGGRSVGETFIAFAVHLVPTAVVVILLVIAWHRTAAGGVLFLAAAAGYAAAVIAGNHPLSWMLPISGPMFLIGTLFLCAPRSLAHTRRA